MVCVFCEIVQGKLPASKVYENKLFLAILDASPMVRGHILVISKKHFANLLELDNKSLLGLGKVMQSVALLLRGKLGAQGINILNASGKVAQQSVFHFHFHLVPRYEGDGLDTWPRSNYKEKNFEEVYKKITGQ